VTQGQRWLAPDTLYTLYVLTLPQVCGAEQVQWVGRCPTCKEWNCVQEYSVRRDGSAGPKRPQRSINPKASGGSNSNAPYYSSSGWLSPGADGYGIATKLTDVTSEEAQRRVTLPGSSEFSRVLGGGLVPGSMVMIGGDPGVGKSTLLLQLAGRLAGAGVLYSSIVNSY
jgi:DNA repair protein RadA/Sms